MKLYYKISEIKLNFFHILYTGPGLYTWRHTCMWYALCFIFYFGELWSCSKI